MSNIVVIGAGRGIGLELVKNLQKEHNIYAITRNNTEELSRTNSKIFIVDITSDNLSVLDNLPEVIHGLVYCPGSIQLKMFNRLTKENFLEDFSQNVLGAISILQKCLPNLKKAEGASVVLYSTVASKLGMPFHASIATSKSALEGLAKSLAAEWAPYKIRVNVIAPSLTDTPLAASLLNTPEKRESSSKRHPLTGIGEPAKIASLTAFLLSENADWMTGQIIGIDGGLSSLKV
jgi:3-oxoacyl-[acyl-carrier protein] reductase